MAQSRKIAVLGGTGFLGGRIVRHLAEHGFAVRIVARHLRRVRVDSYERNLEIESVRADVNDGRAIETAVAGAFGVVNAVSLYVERGSQTFQAVHVRAAESVAGHAQQAGVERLVHVSGIGADERSGSPYIHSRGRGEAVVRRAFPDATIIRPAVMFGVGDAFVTPLASLLRRLPIFAMFGRGQTKLQPACVDDVAEAVARALERAEPRAAYELAGPRTYSYKELLTAIADHIGSRPVLVPMPFGLWGVAGYLAEMLPRPPITRNQVELMQIDNVASPGAPGFDQLGIVPRSLEQMLSTILPKS